jgi:hypothetical protein
MWNRSPVCKGRRVIVSYPRENPAMLMVFPAQDDDVESAENADQVQKRLNSAFTNEPRFVRR